MRYCSIESCSRKHHAKNLCMTHYKIVLYKPSFNVNEYNIGMYSRDGNRYSEETKNEYYIYRQMMRRCYVKSDPRYHNYGGRGIVVCDSWRGKGGFDIFLGDIGKRPPGMWLDRIDNNGIYSKNNCRWSTPSVQAANKRPQSVNRGIRISKSKKYYMHISKDYKRYSAGPFDTIDEAIVVRKSYEIYLYGFHFDR